MLAAVPALAGSQGFTEFTLGQWRGSAEAQGVTSAEALDGSIIIDGYFEADLEFLMTNDGVADGRWELSDGRTSWIILVPGVAGQAGEAGFLHTASGPIVGDRTTLRLPGGAITTQGTVFMSGLGDLAIDTVDGIDAIDMKLTHLLCNDAEGTWVFSWNSQLEDAQFTPTFYGNWHAIRLAPEGEEPDDRLATVVPEILSLRGEMAELWRQPREAGVPIVPYDLVWGLIERAIALINELNNLNRCDRAAFGEDVIARYMNALTNMVQLLTNVLLDNLDAEGEQISGKDLQELATMLASVGAIGEGAVDSEAADITQSRLESEARRAASDENADPVDRSLAEVARIQLGLGGGG